MKIIKIILGIIIALTVVFFSTGFIFPKTELQMEITIDKPINVVFSEIADVHKMKLWLPNIDSVALSKKQAQQQGTTYKLFIKSGEQQATMQQKIITYKENQEISFRYTSKDLLKVDTYLVRKQDVKQTKLVQKTSIAPNSFVLSCTYPWFKGRLEKLHQNYLTNFKKMVEQ